MKLNYIAFTRKFDTHTKWLIQRRNLCVDCIKWALNKHICETIALTACQSILNEIWTGTLYPQCWYSHTCTLHKLLQYIAHDIVLNALARPWSVVHRICVARYECGVNNSYPFRMKWPPISFTFSTLFFLWSIFK